MPRLPSPAQLAAARANGARSRGPVTPEGKASSARNATTHGLTARAVVLGLEDATQFQALLDAMLEEFAPATTAELLCVEEMAAAKWKSRRLWALETATLGLQYDLQAAQPGPAATDPPLDAHANLGLAWSGVQRQLDNFAWHDGRLHRQYNRTLAQLERLQQRRFLAQAAAEAAAADAAKNIFCENEPKQSPEMPEAA